MLKSGNQSQPSNTNPRPDIMGALQGFLPEKGSQQQSDMVGQLVAAGMSSAQGSGSPLLALLAPVLGSAAMNKVGNQRRAAQSETAAEMAASIYGDKANDPMVQSYLKVLSDPNAPDHLKSAAQARLNAAVPAPRAPRTGGSSTPSTGAAGTRLYGEYNIGGILHGRNSQGQMTPYTAPNGDPVKAPETSGGASDFDAALNGNSPRQPETPALDERDPLGILNAPPA